MSLLSVFTQNAWGGFPRWRERGPLLADRISALKPEVVALQEVHGDATGRDTQAHELAARVGDYRVHFAPARVYGLESEGVALLLRHDAQAHDPHALTLDPSDRFEGSNQRIVLGVTVDHPEGPIDVFVTHLSLSRKARARTAAELVGFTEQIRARSRSVAALLCGDLNATPDEPAVSILEEMWIDAWAEANGAHGGGTWPAILPFRRIDYVFVRGEADVEACRRVPYSGSDHLGLLANVRIRGGRPSA